MSPERARTIRVLLVEPDIDELAALAADLRQRGLHVSLANGVAMACERAKTARADVIVAASEVVGDEAQGFGLFDALAVELGQLPPHVVLVRDEKDATSDRLVVRGDLDALLARVEAAADPNAPRPLESHPPVSIDAGSLARVQLADVIATLSVDRRSGTLAISTPSGAGDVRLADGAIVDVVYVRFEAMKALVRLTGETEGRFLFTPDTPPVMRRMHSSTSDLLRDATAQVTEGRRLRAKLGDLAGKALLATDGGEPTELSPAARALLARLRAPATIEDLLDDSPEPDVAVLASVAELDAAGRLRRLAHETQRVPLVSPDQLHLMRALASRAVVPGFAGAARLVFAGTTGRLAVFAHAALCISDAVAAPDPPPTVPIPYAIATVRLGDDVEVDLVALPLVPAYAPLWTMALAGAAIVVRLDDAAGPTLAEACAAADLPVLDAQMLVGALEEASVAQVAGLVRAAIEAAQGER